jgi:opacity protein-like surface antigen
MRRMFVLFATCLLLASTVAFAQDTVPRYDVFTGFSYLSTPKLNLFQRGFNGEAGINVRRWVSLGGDFSVFTGHSSLTADELDPRQLAPLAGLVPPGVLAGVSVPFDATTYTFTAGPQFNYRHWSAITPFIRPAIGGIHEHVTVKPNTPLTTALVGLLIPSGEKSDTTVFWGVGGGFDLNPTRHVGIRLAADFVNLKLFSGLLKDRRNAIRFSIGPTFRWGEMK